MAVQIRKLTIDEAARVFPKRGQMDLSDYTEALRGYKPGDAAEVDLGALSSRAMKRRLGQAANQAGMTLKWAKENGSGNMLRFIVREAPQKRTTGARRGRKPRGSE